MMNRDFPRIITLLRKERKLSQKQAAEELGVSQALLSHYEKGIRECGLDFVVRAAGFYNVSCDYLLGMTADRGTDDSGTSLNVVIKNPMNSQNRRLVASSTDIIYDILAKAGNRRLTRAVHIYMMTGVYKLFRCIYSLVGSDTDGLFAVSEGLYCGYCTAVQEKLFADISDMCNENSGAYIGDKAEDPMTAEALAENYPAEITALFSVINQAESNLNKILK